MVQLLAVPALLVQLQGTLVWSLAVAWRRDCGTCEEDFVPSMPGVCQEMGNGQPAFAKLVLGLSVAVPLCAARLGQP